MPAPDRWPYFHTFAFRIAPADYVLRFGMALVGGQSELRDRRLIILCRIKGFPLFEFILPLLSAGGQKKNRKEKTEDTVELFAGFVRFCHVLSFTLYGLDLSNKKCRRTGMDAEADRVRE
ncbi:MAG: hypothetical protein J6Y92_10285 [Lentisphaeria bacterium]|nr:hypothetical protein [Lentisphaeria bacterium]